MGSEWREAKNRRGGQGKQRDGQLVALARELTEALMERPGAVAPKEGGRKPEWICKACGISNFMDRQCCRRCQGSRSSNPMVGKQAGVGERSAPASGPRLPANSVWADPEPKTPAARAVALERAAATARAAGASDAAAQVLAAEAAEAKKEAVSNKPLGARIDSARARLRKADARLASSREALESAKALHADACSQRDQASAELEALERECALRGGGTNTPDLRMESVLSGARELLLKLEGSPLVSVHTQEPPELVLAAMRTLHAAIAEAAPEPELEMNLDGGRSDDVRVPAERTEDMSGRAEPVAPSEPTGAFPDAAYRGGAGEGANTQAPLDLGGEEMDLEDAALGALVRERLLKRQRPSPY